MVYIWRNIPPLHLDCFKHIIEDGCNNHWDCIGKIGEFVSVFCLRWCISSVWKALHSVASISAVQCFLFFIIWNIYRYSGRYAGGICRGTLQHSHAYCIFIAVIYILRWCIFKQFNKDLFAFWLHYLCPFTGIKYSIPTTKQESSKILYSDPLRFGLFPP